jgi:Na+/H+ antiporter NhaD/arsenite permease-like protein
MKEKMEQRRLDVQQVQYLTLGLIVMPLTLTASALYLYA